MKVASVLDADMATIASWLRDGFDWWIGELRELVPARLRERSARRGPEIEWDGADGFTPCGGVELGDVRNPVIRLPHRLCLARTVPLPAVGARDLSALLAMEAERIMPMSSAAMLIAAAPAGPRNENGLMPMRVAGMASAQAERLCTAITQAELKPSSVILPDKVAVINFLPAMRESGLLAAHANGARIWWVLVALMFALNISFLVWRDLASVEQLGELVEVQKPAALAAQRSAARMQSATRTIARAVARRDRHNALAALGAVSQALPSDAWVQRLAWDGESLRLTGYKSRTADPIKLLRQSGLYADVRSANSDVLAEIPAGQPFDIVAKIGTH